VTVSEKVTAHGLDIRRRCKGKQSLSSYVEAASDAVESYKYWRVSSIEYSLLQR
jgi:hypothetical protein